MTDLPPRLGLALGSGAARGLAHIGVLKVLEEEQIPIGQISGTSIGALIGALYAAGVSWQQMAEIACGVDWRQLASLLDPILPTSGLIDGRRIRLFMEEFLPVEDFEQLSLPLAITATDIESGAPLIIRQGNLLDALQAAIAFPGIMTPVRFGDRYLVDGGLCNPVPIDILPSLGARQVIGVCTIPRPDRQPVEASQPGHRSSERSGTSRGINAGRFEQLLRDIWRSPLQPNGKRRKPPGLLRVAAQSVAIMENQINDLRLQQHQPDLLLRPQLDDFTLLDFQRAAEAIAAGERETRRHLAKIHRLIRA